MPAGARVHVGTYGVNREASITVHTFGPAGTRRCSRPRYEPPPGSSRTLTPEEERKVSPVSPGACPTSRPPGPLAVAAHRAGASRSAAATATRSGTRGPTGSRSSAGSWTSSAHSSQARRAASTASSCAASSRGSPSGEGARRQRGQGLGLVDQARAQPRAAPGDGGAESVLAAARPRGLPHRRRGVPELRRRSGESGGRRRTDSVRSPPADRCAAASPAATSQA